MYFGKLRSNSRISFANCVSEEKMPKNCKGHSSVSDSFDVHAEDCNCADEASQRVDELLKRFDEVEEQKKQLEGELE